MIISVTEREVFKRCVRRWMLSSNNKAGLEPLIPRQVLQIGTVYHRAHADWIADQSQSLADWFLHYANKELDRIRANYKRVVGADISDEELEDSISGMAMGHAMCQNYQKRWTTPLPEGFTLVAPEQVIICPIPNTEHTCTTCDGAGSTYALVETDLSVLHKCPTCKGTGTVVHYLEGTLDGLIRDDKGYLYVLERKTYGSRPRQEVLDHSDQFLGYIWLTTQLGVGEVAGVAYDGAWKREKPPAGKTLDDMFLRVILRRSAIEVQEFERFLTAEALQMASDIPETINRRWEGCSDCDVERICTAMSRGEDVDYVVKTFFTKRSKESYEAKTPEQFRKAYAPASLV